MDLTQLANLGEFIGGVAVLVTLVYLATQVRQNTRAVSAATFHAISSETSGFVARVAENPELAALLEKGFLRPDELSPSERFRVGFWLRATFRLNENYFYQTDYYGVLDSGVGAGYTSSLSEHARIPFVREWWGTAKGAFSPSFQAHFDGVLESTEPSETSFTRNMTAPDVPTA